MKQTKIFCSVLAVAALLSSNGLRAEHDEEHKLSKAYGCVACHSLAPAEGDAKALPVGPSFKEIAERYHGQSGDDQYQELYRIVKYGSSPYRSKWKGKVSGLAMPPNDDTISDLDINRLLVWILTKDHDEK